MVNNERGLRYYNVGNRQKGAKMSGFFIFSLETGFEPTFTTSFKRRILFLQHKQSTCQTQE